MMVTRIKRGVYGGVAGGVVFGGMMGVMGMLTMIGSMVGSSSAWVRFVVHMIISGAIGGTFGAVVDLSGLRANVGTGLAYGVMWWVLGPLTLMPAFMGMGFRRELERRSHERSHAEPGRASGVRGDPRRHRPVAGRPHAWERGVSDLRESLLT